jgi:2-dehydropantoate 2-reductase
MKVAIMGTGGVGGYLGARVAKGGADVHFVARGAHLAAMKNDGLRVRGVESITLPSVNASDDPRDIGLVDAVLFCVKLYDTQAAAKLVAPLVGENTMVLTLQNGINSVPELSKILGAQHILGGAAYFPASLTGPGEITYLGKIAARPHVAFGEPGGGASDRVEQLAATLRTGSVEVDVSADTDRLLWEKFLLIAGTSAATALTRSTMGVVRSDPDMRWLLHEAVAEAERVGRACGVDFVSDITNATMAVFDTNPADGKASMLVDLENGRRLELDGLSGTVVKLGQKHGIPTPVHRTVCAALKPFVNG